MGMTSKLADITFRKTFLTSLRFFYQISNLESALSFISINITDSRIMTIFIYKQFDQK